MASAFPAVAHSRILLSVSSCKSLSFDCFKQFFKIHINIASVSDKMDFYEAFLLDYQVNNTICTNGKGTKVRKLVNKLLSGKWIMQEFFNAAPYTGFYLRREFFSRVLCFRQISKMRVRSCFLFLSISSAGRLPSLSQAALFFNPAERRYTIKEKPGVSSVFKITTSSAGKRLFTLFPTALSPALPSLEARP